MEEQPDKAVAGAAEPQADAAARDWAAWAQAAAARKDWDAAQQRWSRCIDKFGPRSRWLARRGHALLQLERLDDAEEVFLALSREDSHNPEVIAGLADIALRRNEPARARQLLSSWRDLNADIATPAIARLLLRLGDAEQSLAQWEQLVREHPAVTGFQAQRIRALIEVWRDTGANAAQREALAAEIRDRLLAAADENMSMFALSLFGLIDANSDATNLLNRCIREVRSLSHMASCFRLTSVFIERGSRGALWEMLLGRVQRERHSPGDVLAARELELCILLALGRQSDFCTLIDAAGTDIDRMPAYLFLRRVRERLAKPRREVFLEPKVFGIGLTKTGTTSIHEALMRLGIDSAHWTNPLTHELLSDADIYMFGAASDICISQEFEKLYYLYPNARFIWTRRPFETWQASFQRHHARFNWARTFDEVRAYYERPGSHFGFSSAAAHFQLYLNADNLAEAYQAYEKRVRSFFADKRASCLLELDVTSGQGWPDLCTFLGVPVPALPFPRANKSRPIQEADHSFTEDGQATS